MMTSLCLLAAVLSADPVPPGFVPAVPKPGAPEWVVTLCDDANEFRAQQAAHYLAELADVRRSLATIRDTVPRDERREVALKIQDKISKLEAEATRWLTDKHFVRPFRGNAPVQGDAGRWNEYGKVEQVLDDSTMIVRYGSRGMSYVVVCETDGIADGNTIQFGRVWLVDGTRRLVTVLGATRTLPVMRPVEPAEWIR